MNEDGKILPSEIYTMAVKVMKPEDIDHHNSDLYLRVTAASQALIEQFAYGHMVQRFRSNIEPYDWWFELPFCYTPYWEGKTGGNDNAIN